MINRLEKNTDLKSGVPTRTIFMGTPDFAVPILESLLKLSQVSLIAVVTQPDRPVGRKQVLTPPPIKVLAQQHDIEVLQPEKLREIEIVEQIKLLKPELIIVAAYGQIIPKSILEIPKFGTINVHASLLPKYRGASPIQAVIAAGEQETGITIMLMDELLDHGPILAQAIIPIIENETGGSLFEKLSVTSAQLLSSTLPRWISGGIKPENQDHNEATMTKLLKRENGKIDWSQPADSIERMIRAYHPWPGTWTTWQHGGTIRTGPIFLRLQVHCAKIYSKNLPSIIPGRDHQIPGAVRITDESIIIACKNGAVELLELQLEGKRSMSAKEFLHGYRDINEAILK